MHVLEGRGGNPSIALPYNSSYNNSFLLSHHFPNQYMTHTHLLQHIFACSFLLFPTVKLPFLFLRTSSISTCQFLSNVTQITKNGPHRPLLHYHTKRTSHSLLFYISSWPLSSRTSTQPSTRNGTLPDSWPSHSYWCPLQPRPTQYCFTVP